jgi:hypothetical protein
MKELGLAEWNSDLDELNIQFEKLIKKEAF